MRVVRPVRGEVCWIKKQSDGTAFRVPGDEGLTNCSSGREKRPAERAWTVTMADDGALSIISVVACSLLTLSPAANEVVPGHRVNVDVECCAYKVAIVEMPTSVD